MGVMAGPTEVLAVATTMEELVPYLVVMLGGFLVGAWGQASRSTIAVIAGMALIIIAVAGFLAENGSGPIPEVLK